MPSWFQLISPAMTHFRRERAQQIQRRFPDISRMSVLDLGGSHHFWKAVEQIIRPAKVTVLNVTDDATANATEESGDIVLYDGRTIPFGDRSIDLLICNSVIEHVPLEARAPLAREIERVARRYVVQTPAFEFPVEPHLVAPFIHWLPRSVGRPLSRLTPRAFASGRPATVVFDEVHLLRAKDVASLFPDAELVTERFLGLPKSYLAFGQAV